MHCIQGYFIWRIPKKGIPILRLGIRLLALQPNVLFLLRLRGGPERARRLEQFQRIWQISSFLRESPFPFLLHTREHPQNHHQATTTPSFDFAVSGQCVLAHVNLGQRCTGHFGTVPPGTVPFRIWFGR